MTVVVVVSAAVVDPESINRSIVTIANNSNSNGKWKRNEHDFHFYGPCLHCPLLFNPRDLPTSSSSTTGRWLALAAVVGLLSIPAGAHCEPNKPWPTTGRRVVFHWWHGNVIWCNYTSLTLVESNNISSGGIGNPLIKEIRSVSPLCHWKRVVYWSDMTHGNYVNYLQLMCAGRWSHIFRGSIH